MEIKPGKNGKKSWVFFFKLQQVLHKFFFRFGQILFNLAGMFAVHHEKSFVAASFKVSITDHLFDNLKSGKRNHCFGEKSLH